MPKISFRPSCAEDLDSLRRSARKSYQRACEVLLELQRDIGPSARRRAEGRIPKCYQHEYSCQMVTGSYSRKLNPERP